MLLTCIFCGGAKCSLCSFKGQATYGPEDQDQMYWYRLFQGQYIKEYVSRSFFVEKTGLTEYSAYVDSATW